jgi:hypothetical protein
MVDLFVVLLRGDIMTNAMYAARSLHNDKLFFDSSEIRIRNNRTRRQKIVRRQYMLIMSIVTMIISSFIFIHSSLSLDAQSDDYKPDFKYYQSLTVHSGDTLWSIASANYDSDHYDDVDEYISEICNINGIRNASSLKAGENLIVPYYSNEFK